MLGRIEAVRAFLDADRLAANAVGAHRISVMFHAAMSGDTAIPELLLSYGGGEGIEGALHGAVAYNHIDMARWLLEHGVARNIDALNYESKTPLQVATGSSSAEMIALLRAHGAME